jgi:dolichol-phosphate mannosyltransferase
VVIPTYNERENLGPILDRLHKALPDVHVLVVDDGSPDGTGELADALAAGDRQVHVLHRQSKGGLGRAYVAGFRWALGRGYQTLVQLDADGSHLPEQLPALLAALGDADLVLGSRWVPGGQVVDWPAGRRALSRGGNTYVRWVLGLPLRDATGGFRAFRRTTLEALDLEGVASHGYCFQVDLAWRTLQAGCRVVEVPITFVERQRGVSKMSGAVVREALWRVTLWGVAHRWAQARGAVSARVPRRDRGR